MIQISPNALYRPADMRQMFGATAWLNLLKRVKLRRIPGGYYLGSMLIEDLARAVPCGASPEPDEDYVSIRPRRQSRAKAALAEVMERHRGIA